MNMRGIICSILLAGGGVAARADDLTSAIERLKSARPGVGGNRELQAAWQTASRVDFERLPQLLAALDDAQQPAANWIGSAVDAACERAEAANERRFAPALEAFTVATLHRGAARRLAYERLVRLDPSAADRLLSKFLDDPSVELRRDAVERLAVEAANSQDDAATAIYRRAFAAARDLDQINDLAEKLKQCGVEVDLPAHFGFITRWQLLGPLDNTAGRGFHTAYPPETKVELDATYPGKSGEPIAWRRHETDDRYGMVDLNAALGKNKGAVAYAYAELVVDRPQQVDVRIGCINAVKLWVNGRLLDEHETYHAGTQIDQYTVTTMLTAGTNTMLLKVCENEQTEAWAQDWQFQLRVCDAVGTAVTHADTAVKK